MMRPVGTFAIPPDHPSLEGHFPARPIVPGVVLLDEITVLIQTSEPALSITGFPTIRFTRPVRPGDIVQVAHGGDVVACTVNGHAVLHGTISRTPAHPQR